jgi:putative nucleotidyltransferase with HDIG domain
LIRLRLLDSTSNEGVWESTGELRIGREESFEISVAEPSVSRQHAHIFATSRGWRVRDLKSTNGTFVNGKRVTTMSKPIWLNDVIRCGSLSFVVDAIAPTKRSEIESPVGSRTQILDQANPVVVDAQPAGSWEKALKNAAVDSDSPLQPGEKLVALLRAGHHLGHTEDEKELLHAILNDAVTALDAQRGAIVLAEGPNNALEIKALSTSSLEQARRTAFSQSLAQLAFSRDESILCQNVHSHPQLACSQSITEGTMASVLCVLLRTPRRRLGVLHLDRGPLQKPFTKDDLAVADALAATMSAGIESARLFRQQGKLFLNTITILAQAVELRDGCTAGHTARVAQYAERLARELKVSQVDLDWIRLGTPLHDVGKIGIDDAILKKSGALTTEEFEIMKTHTLKGAMILSTVPDLAPIIPIVRSHHERWDGHGYPDGLAGGDIPLLARIVAVADSFDAMTSDRPYRKAMSPDIAFAEVKKQSRKQFDPECASAFTAIRESILKIMEEDPSGLSGIELKALPVSYSA